MPFSPNPNPAGNTVVITQDYESHSGFVYTNRGTFIVDANKVAIYDQFINRADFTIADGASFENLYTSFVNIGTFTNNHLFVNSGIFANYGVFINQSDAITVSFDSLGYFANVGLFSGLNSFQGSIIGSGTISVGTADKPEGVLSIAGAVRFGQLDLSVAGTEADDFDFLFAKEVYFPTGIINFTVNEAALLADIAPGTSESITVLTTGNLTAPANLGSFAPADTANLDFTFRQDGNSLVLDIKNLMLPPNLPPTAVDFANVVSSLDENTSTESRIKVADINISDDGQGTNALTLGGADANAFELVGPALYLKAGTSLNYEAKSSYSVIINADDASVGSSPDISRAFTLTVKDVNEAPVANDDSGFTGGAGVTKVIPIASLLGNDTDPDANASLSIVAVSSSNGAVTISGGNILFTASANNTSGRASFDYTLSDGKLVDTATVSLAVGRTINGGNGTQSLTGTAGDDIIRGFNGEDTLFGAAGDDWLEGGNGADKLTGGAGRDTFVLAKNAGGDIIADFADGVDVIGLIGGLTFNQLSIRSSGTSTLIQQGGDTLATLTGVAAGSITSADFILV